MAYKQTPPFRAEHVGSLLRPDYLLEAYRKFDNKEVTPGQLREVEDRAVKEAIDFQREVGIRGITDVNTGLRHAFFNGFFDSLEGIQVTLLPPLNIFRTYLPNLKSFTTTGKIKHVKSHHVEEFEALKKLVHPEEVKNLKITIVSPDWLDLHHGRHAFTPEVYNSRIEFFDDIAAAYRQELAALYAVGCRNIQIDAPLLTAFCDVTVEKAFADDGEDVNSLLDAYIKLFNDCLAGRPQDLTVAFHLCRGNWRSTHFVEGGYDRIAKKLFNEVNVDSYYDTARAGTSEPLKYLPRHKSVVLGLITSKFPELEDKEQVRQQVFDAARIIASGTGETAEEALQRISLSPQCGFASTQDGNSLTAADMRRKLELVRDLAASIWVDA